MPGTPCEALFTCYFVHFLLYFCDEFIIPIFRVRKFRLKSMILSLVTYSRVGVWTLEWSQIACISRCSLFSSSWASQVVSSKEATCQCRRCRRQGFEPWFEKIPYRRKWQLTPVLLPGKSHGQKNLAGYSPRSCKESDMTASEHACTHFLLKCILRRVKTKNRNRKTSSSFVINTTNYQ